MSSELRILASDDHGKTSVGDRGDEAPETLLEDADELVSDGVGSSGSRRPRRESEGESAGVSATESRDVEDELLALVREGSAGGDERVFEPAVGDSGMPGEAAPGDGGPGSEKWPGRGE
jgi:hypothetical protein